MNKYYQDKLFITMNRLIEKYNKLAEEAELSKGTLRSKEWFAKLIQGESQIRNLRTVTDGFERNTRLQVGNLIAFEYDAKTKETLPYWDRYPLALVTSVDRTGWHGLNLHYLHPRIRARLLFEYQKRDIPIIDNDLAKLSHKRYLASHVKSAPKDIPLQYWDLVIQMPFENFQKATKHQVWRKTR